MTNLSIKKYGGVVIEQDLMKDIMWESAKEAFETMISLPLENIDSQDQEPDCSASLICTITFSGQIQGSFSVQCPVSSAEQMGKAMLMMDADEAMQEAEVSDALGEITNILLGGIKSRLSDTAPDMQISIPTTIKGTEIRPAMGKIAERIELKAKAGDNVIKLIIMYKAKKETSCITQKSSLQQG